MTLQTIIHPFIHSFTVTCFWYYNIEYNNRARVQLQLNQRLQTHTHTAPWTIKTIRSGTFVWWVFPFIFTSFFVGIDVVVVSKPIASTNWIGFIFSFYVTCITQINLNNNRKVNKYFITQNYFDKTLNDTIIVARTYNQKKKNKFESLTKLACCFMFLFLFFLCSDRLVGLVYVSIFQMSVTVIIFTLSQWKDRALSISIVYFDIS